LRRNQPRGQSRDAARFAVLSTFALLGCAVAQGTLRALLGFIWVILLITALALEWSARRRLRRAQAAKRSSRDRPPGAGGRAPGRTRARRAR
jgi:hypothetical protein